MSHPATGESIRSSVILQHFAIAVQLLPQIYFLLLTARHLAAQLWQSALSCTQDAVGDDSADQVCCSFFGDGTANNGET